MRKPTKSSIRRKLDILWSEISGYEGLYQISNNGEVRSLNRRVGHRYKHVKRIFKGKIIKQNNNGNGYLQVNLYSNGKRSVAYVHRLVASHFVDNPYNKSCINHIDNNKNNNCCDNLEWVTQKENVMHSKAQGRMPFGEKHYKSNISNSDVTMLRLLYSDYGYSFNQLAKLFSITENHAYRIATYRKRTV